MSELTQAQRGGRALFFWSDERLTEQDWDALHERVRRQFCEKAEAVLAGLRYQDEVSDEEVEAAEKVIYELTNWPCPDEIARAALKAARAAKQV